MRSGWSLTTWCVLSLTMSTSVVDAQDDPPPEPSASLDVRTRSQRPSAAELLPSLPPDLAARQRRQDSVLADVRWLAEEGRSERALSVLEAALRPPSLVWDHPSAVAVQRALSTLRVPSDQSALRAPGFVLGIPGLLGLVMTSVVFAVIPEETGVPSGCVYELISCGGSPGPPRLETFGALWALSGTLFVTGVMLVLGGTNLFNSSAPQFRERQQRISRSIRCRAATSELDEECP